MPLLGPKYIEQIIHADATQLQEMSFDITGILPHFMSVLEADLDALNEFCEKDFEIVAHDFDRFKKLEKIDAEAFPALAKIKTALTVLAQNNITPVFSNIDKIFIDFFNDILQSVPNTKETIVIPPQEQLESYVSLAEQEIKLSPLLKIDSLATSLDTESLQSPGLSEVSSAGDAPELFGVIQPQEQWSKLADSTTDDLTTLIHELSASTELTREVSVVKTKLSKSLSHLRELIAETEEKKHGLSHLARSLSESISHIEELQVVIDEKEVKDSVESPQVLEHIRACVDAELIRQERKILQDLGEVKVNEANVITSIKSTKPQIFAAKCFFARSNKGELVDPKSKLAPAAKLDIYKIKEMQVIKRNISSTQETQLKLKELEELKKVAIKKCDFLLKENHFLDLVGTTPATFFSKQHSAPEASDKGVLPSAFTLTRAHTV